MGTSQRNSLLVIQRSLRTRSKFKNLCLGHSTSCRSLLKQSSKRPLSCRRVKIRPETGYRVAAAVEAASKTAGRSGGSSANAGEGRNNVARANTKPPRTSSRHAQETTERMSARYGSRIRRSVSYGTVTTTLNGSPSLMCTRLPLRRGRSARTDAPMSPRQLLSRRRLHKHMCSCTIVGLEQESPPATGGEHGQHSDLDSSGSITNGLH